MIEVSFQGKARHCFANNPQSDAGSDTQDTNTMNQPGCGFTTTERRLHGTVGKCSCVLSGAPKRTQTQCRCGKDSQILYKKMSRTKPAALVHAHISLRHDFLVLTRLRDNCRNP